MSRFTVGLGRVTLADQFFPRGLATDAVLIVTGASLASICAQVVIPVGPIPVTAQTMAALFVGMLLGALRGALAMALYVAMGWAGLPVFSDGGSGAERLFGPSGGYIFGYILAALLVGWIAERGWDRTFPRASLSALIGTVSIYLVGVPWHAASVGADFAEVVTTTVGIFVLSDTAKAILTAIGVSACWSWARRSEQEELRRNPGGL